MSLQENGGKQSEGPTAAKPRSADIIEDDISDYPKDRNLSLFMLQFQLDHCYAFSSIGSFLALCETCFFDKLDVIVVIFSLYICAW